MAGVSGLSCGRSQASGGVMERGREGRRAVTRVPLVVTAGHCNLAQYRVKPTAPSKKIPQGAAFSLGVISAWQHFKPQLQSTQAKRG